ncbi:unnamed protein product [Clavelina lepadiformis]|uniref:Hydantoinase/oxoprolinase N-terminal domain-containing protein n=1 Tax=Clavelina lepadiformis TaxID=159417 RepID=A0ABP0G6B3_CLALP
MIESFDSSKIDFIRIGTTVATNALLERKGERMALALTKVDNAVVQSYYPLVTLNVQ